MKNRTTHIILILLLLSSGLAAQNSPEFEWNGYTQLRFTGNFSDVNSFGVRRMKLWLNSGPGFSEHWGFHIQTTLSSLQDEKFVLQDVMAFYKTGRLKVNMGQFIPGFGYQRFQSDYAIPFTERSDVINMLIPDGTLGVRDIGIEGNLMSRNKMLQTWLGIFNGYGIQSYRLDYSGCLLTHKTQLSFYQGKVQTGYSLMYRKADQLMITKVLPDSVLFSGNDVRFNLFIHFHNDKLILQAEYIRAFLNKQSADGYYLLAAYVLNKNQFTLSWNKYTDLISTSNDAPVMHAGYNYSFKEDKLKVMLDNGLKVNNGKLEEYLLILQVQLFFK